MSNKRHSKPNKFLPPFGILITSENTLIRFTRILWRYEAKTYTNILYEDLQSQNVQFRGQISKSRRKSENCHKTGVTGQSWVFRSIHKPQYSNKSEILQASSQLIYLQVSCFEQGPNQSLTWSNVQYENRAD